MAIDRGKDYYKYGSSWFYAMPNEKYNVVAKALGFDRPDCKSKTQNL